MKMKSRKSWLDSEPAIASSTTKLCAFEKMEG